MWGKVLTPTWDKSAHAWISLLRVRFGYCLVTVLLFVDSTNVDKIFVFNLRPKLILLAQQMQSADILECPRRRCNRTPRGSTYSHSNF